MYNFVRVHKTLRRMIERDISFLDVVRVLRGGDIVGDITAGNTEGEWKCKIVARRKGGQRLGRSHGRPEERATVCEDGGVGGPLNQRFYRSGEKIRPAPYPYRASGGLEGIYLLNGYRVEEHDGEQHVSIQPWRQEGRSCESLRPFAGKAQRDRA
ncbi:MAG TPA: hypothetical protein VGS12_17655 [Caulobacteraceae bacterium]|nr:hypothetical protein [Caulobacteraceae bacterium]